MPGLSSVGSSLVVSPDGQAEHSAQCGGRDLEATVTYLDCRKVSFLGSTVGLNTREAEEHAGLWNIECRPFCGQGNGGGGLKGQRHDDYSECWTGSSDTRSGHSP